jgi:nitrate/TMAO reductase-like tetraheme cytochrome c subunit
MNGIRGFFSSICNCCSSQNEDPITQYTQTIEIQNAYRKRMDELAAQIPEERLKAINEKLKKLVNAEKERTESRGQSRGHAWHLGF